MKIKLIKHKDINSETLLDIIKVKSIAWPYPLNKQIEWIENNLKDDDIHVLLTDDKSKTVAYLNIVKTSISIDDEIHKCWGVGNVCSIKKGSGFGKEILNLVNEWITKSNCIGLLFCKEELIPYYEKTNWRSINKKNINLCNNENISVMTFNHTGFSYQYKYCLPFF